MSMEISQCDMLVSWHYVELLASNQCNVHVKIHKRQLLHLPFMSMEKGWRWVCDDIRASQLGYCLVMHKFGSYMYWILIDHTFDVTFDVIGRHTTMSQSMQIAARFV